MKTAEKIRWDKISAHLKQRYHDTQDPWDFDWQFFIKSAKALTPLYEKYFRVRVFGAENIPKERAFMVVSNHTGQIPVDGVMITMAFLFHSQQHVVLRSMVERFLVQLPFLGSLAAKTGSILGDRDNCNYLIKKKESILIFPEGVRGISKPTKKFYQVQPFTTGFYRLAAENNLPILPIAVVGAEEMYPKVYHSKFIAKLLNIPSAPVTPFMALLGPLALLPLPAPIDIHIGKLTEVITKPDASQLSSEIKNLQTHIQGMVSDGLTQKRPYFNEEEKEKIIQQCGLTTKKWIDTFKDYVRKS